MVVALLLIPYLGLLCGGTTTGDLTTLVTEATIACDANDTACGSTTSTTVNATTTPAPLPARVNLKVYQQNVDTCTCDLQAKFCDVNCCCDKDCSAADKKVFTSCQEEQHFNRDTSFCNFMDYIYLNNTPYEWEVNQNGFFCIVKTNLPPKYTLQSYQSITSFEDIKVQKRSRYVWPETEEYQSVVHLRNDSYLYGSDIWVFRNHTLEVFELPRSFLTHACLAKEKVQYLKNFKTQCNVGLNLDNVQLQSMTYYANVSFIRDPQLLNSTWNCPRNICLPGIVKVCTNGNCTALNTTKPALCQINVNTSERICFNLVRKVHYNFYHNGSQGLTEIELLVTLTNVSFWDEGHELKQQFELSFFWHNTTLNYSQSRSGNPGYITGKPLLIGNINNRTVLRTPELIYENFLAFPVSRQGVCALNNELHVLSEFRYNMLLKCRVQKDLDLGNSSAGDLCRKAQRAIFAFWPVLINSTMEKVVGVFGNANESSEAQWVKILWSNSSDSVLNGTLGNFTEDNCTLICHNLVTTLKVDVFHAQIDLEKLLRQEKILAVAFDFDRGRKYFFSVDDQVYLDVMISEQVTYFDVTTERVEKYAQPPSFKINLPYDFFYPFVKVGNSGHGLRACYLVKMIMYFNVVSRWCGLNFN